MTAITQESESEAEATFDPHDPATITLAGGDPYAGYMDMAERCPVFKSEMHGGFWAVFGYEENFDVVEKPDVFSSYPVTLPPFEGQAGPMIPIEVDPPMHLKYRTLVSAPFSPPRIAALEPYVRARADEILNPLIERGECDLAEEYAVALTASVVASIIGFPEDDYERFVELTHEIINLGVTQPERQAAAVVEFYTKCYTLIEERRAEPLDDVISGLLVAEVEGQRLTDEEILDFCLILLLAGFDTTAKTLGSSLWYLGTHPEERQWLADDPDRMPGAVEEFLRYFSAVWAGRTAVREYELAGERICPGERLINFWAGANRSAERFERPNEVILDRQDNRHYAFGAGIHRCLGTHLARLELRVAIEQIINRADFDVCGEPEWHTGQAQGIAKLPARLVARGTTTSAEANR